jgi:protein TonB
MSLITKENENLTANPEIPGARPAAPAARADEAAGRPQPVALEVPVTVNGARTVEGSDKREPFSETTKTVLVFGNGAVIRLSSAVAPGQLLFLTNEKTKKEVVCQVVKSKNYRSVSGYVELEFTESVVGYWGMRFPTDKIASAPPAASALPTPSAVPPAPAKPAAPPVAVLPKPEPVLASSPQTIPEVQPIAAAPVAPKTVPSVSSTSLTSSSPNASSLSLPRAAEVKPAVIAPKPPAPIVPAPIIPAPTDTTTLPRVPEAKVSVPVEIKAPPAPVHADESTEALKRQTARLQEELSSLLFAEAETAKNAPVPAAVAPAGAASLTESAPKILEFAKPAATPPPPPVTPVVASVVSSVPPPAPIAPPVPVERAHTPASVPPPSKSLLDLDEDVKIPAWLEPLARNAAAPVSTQDLIEREKARHAAALLAKPEVEELAADPLPAAEPEAPLDLQVPTFGSSLPTDDAQYSSETSSQGSKKGLWIGLIAAALIVAAGGAWYFNQSSAPVHGSAPATAAVTAPAVSNTVQPQSTPTTTNSPVSAPSSSPANSSPSSASRNQVVQSAAPVGSLLNANAKVEVTRAPQPASPEPQPKKPSLGEVRLASPTVNRAGANQNSSEPEPAIEGSGETSSSGEGLGSGVLGGNSRQPSAPVVPLPVGGDVKSAKLISSVAPLYSTLAKSQHVSGDVKIDALIDATGRVTTMKIVSGPTLLHQSAMDALRQWKYQPATLDGKPVPMHLTVTIQFRMQ